MAQITTQSLTTTLQNFAATVQGAVSQLIDFNVGAVLRAIGEGIGSIALWLQGQIIYVLSITRASTSNAADLDTWFADYSFTRLPAVAASGQVTFSRFTNTNQAAIPVGSLVQTGDGSQQFKVVADTTNPAYSASLLAFVIAAGASSLTCSVVAVTNGPSGSPDSLGNVSASSITALSQPIQYVDTVSNTLAFTNGANPESDSAARARFVLYIASLQKATKVAVNAAIASLQQNVTNTFTENFNYAGAAQNGYFFVVVDDGTGTPPGSFLSSVYNAIDAVRPVTSTFGVFAPVVVTATIGLTVTNSSGYTHPAVTAAVQAAIVAYVNSLPLGVGLSYSRIAQIAYDASAGVTNVTAVTLNGGTADLAATNLQIIKTSNATVSVA